MKVNTFSCPDATSVQFNKKYYGPFSSNTLNKLPQSDVAYFKFNINVPHFKREYIIDMIFMRGLLLITNLDYLIDNKITDKNSVDVGQQVREQCDLKGSTQNRYFEEFFRYRKNYNSPFDKANYTEISISESYFFGIEPALMISSIQLNVGACHPSCLTCKDQDIKSCQSCSQNANFLQGTCTCKVSGQYFQDGQCVKNCDNLSYYHLKKSTDQVCYFVQNCIQWDNQNQKCSICDKNMLPQQDQCVNNCSSGFENIFNTKSKQHECLLIDRFKNDLISNPQVKVSLNDQNLTISPSSIQNTQDDICGFDQPDFVGISTLYAQLNSQNNVLSIINQGDSYLGIREITIYAFNCLQDNCQQCIQNKLNTTCSSCNQGYYLYKGNCVQCNTTCFTCSNSSSCDKCLPNSGLILNQNNQCVCSEYFYFDSLQTSCSACLNKDCLTCQESDSTQCLSCKAPLALLGTECVKSCGIGMTANQNTNQCQKCIQNCSNCDNKLSSCNLCLSGYFFLNDKCISICPDGYFGDVQNAICTPCSESFCSNCVQSKDICTKCLQNKYVDINNNQCISDCSNTQYQDSGYCKNCSNLYSNCVSCDQNVCKQCNNNLLVSVDQKQCINSCPSGTVQKDNQCQKCKANCSICDINFVCLTCNSTTFLYQGECLATCPSGYYNDQYNQCQLCSNQFNNCSNCSANQCLSCINNSNGYKYLAIKNTQCLQNCGIGQYSDSQNQCQLCSNINCLTCDQTNPITCLSCDPNNSNGYIFLDQSGNCVKQCSPQQFSDSTNVCKDCKQYDANCNQCNSTYCLQCNPGYCLNIDVNLKLSSCVQSTTTCQNNCQAKPNCLVCDSVNCQVCQKDNFLLNGNCVSGVNVCAVDQFYNSQQQTCQMCNTKFGQQCLECNQNSCTMCDKPSQYILNNICAQSCGDGYYADNQKTCQPCLNSNCLSCDTQNPSNCLTCSNAVVGKNLLQNYDCVNQCNEGYNKNNNECLPCQNDCQICNNNQCLKCKNLIDINQINCISECPTGQYQGINSLGNGACFECSSLFHNCSQCSAQACISCLQPFYLYNSNNTCNDSCPDKYYADKNKVCQQCQNQNCKTCDISDTSKCLSCIQNGQYPYLNESSNCVSQCQSNEYQYIEDSNLKCKACSNQFGSSCQECNSQACLKCVSSQYISSLDKNSCVTDCPSGQYGNTQSNLCQNCENARCNKCDQQNPSQCLSCKSEYPYLQSGQCLSQCQEGFFPDLQNKCQSCSSTYDSNCIECNSQACTSCSNSTNLFLYKNTCVQQCPDFYYPFSQNYKACKSCLDPKCKQCDPFEPSKCLSCSLGLYLFNGSCVIICPYGTITNKINNTCVYCYSQFNSCQECTEQNCTSCLNDLFLLEDTQQCVSSCPFNYVDSSSVLNPSQSNQNLNKGNKKVCKKCTNKNCNTCDLIDTNKCLSCTQNLENSPNKYLYNQDCIQNCDKYVNQATNECFDSCPNYLLQVVQTKQCEECPQFIQSRECVKQCSLNTYIDNIHQKLCVVCQDQYDANCTSCNSQTCLKCSQDLYLYKNKCYSQCPANTFFDQENHICLDKCTSPQVIIDSKQCSSLSCPLGQYKQPVNTINQIVCGLCDEKCKECTNKSSFCTVCSQGSGWDCLDKEDFDIFLKNQYCEYLIEESDIQKCSLILTESSIQTKIIDIASVINVIICLALILGNHTFIGVYSIYYIQIFQLIGNYVLIETQGFKLVSEVLTKYFLAFNILNLIPQPFERENYSDLMTNFNYKTLIFDIHNLSKYFYLNNFYQLALLFIAVLLAVILINKKNFLKIGTYIKNNIIPKLFLVCSNMILLSSINNITNSIYLSTLDRIVVYGSLIFYFGVLCYIINIIYFYRIQATLISNNLQKFFLVESLDAHFSKRIFWILFELRKILCCFFIVFYNKYEVSIWISLAISFVFIMILTLYCPFSSKLESGLLVFLESIYLITQLLLVFMSQLDKIQSLITIMVVFLFSCTSINIFLISRKIYQLVKQKRNEYRNQLLTNQEPIKLNEMSFMSSFARSTDFNKEKINYFKQKNFRIIVAIQPQSIDDRNMAYLNPSNNINMQTFSCPDANSVQFKTEFFGPFDTNTLSQSQGFKIAYFSFDVQVPHFKREVIIDIIFMRSQSPTTLTFQIDGDKRGKLYTDSQKQFSEICKESEPFTYKEFEQFFRQRYSYESYQQEISKANKIVVQISESKILFITPGLMISSIQINVSTCHPSCLTCKKSDNKSCLSCSQDAQFQYGVCTCKNSGDLFQDGLCIPKCNKDYYHQKKPNELVCSFINKCTQWDAQNQKCQTCIQQMLPQQDMCVTDCSSGFEKVFNTQSNKFECLMIDRYKQVSIILSAFHSNSFSGIEVESISGLSYNQFLQQSDNDSQVSKCNQYQLFGGFFINQYASNIIYNFQAAGFNFVKVYFKYVVIDIPSNGNFLIKVKLNDQQKTIQNSNQDLSSKKDICGFKELDLVGTFSMIASLKSQNALNILNNGDSYFGIREISIYSFDCLQDNCQQCTASGTQTSCLDCNSGYYLSSGECLQCNPMCLTCSDSKTCINCKPVQGLTLNSSNQCVCQDYFYFDSTNIICKPCLTATCLTCKANSNQCLSCQKPLALLGTECVDSCGIGKAVDQITNQCQKCISNCQNCDNNLSSCNQCYNGFFFLNNKCISQCPDGYYGDEQNAICTPCTQSECINCTQSKHICTKCQVNFFVDINKYQCIPKCYDNQYIDQGYCKNCSELYAFCNSCILNQCNQCSDNLVLSVNQQQCLNICPLGTVQDGQKCVQCKNNCSSCDVNLVCQVCISKFYLHQGNCLSSCPSGYYPNKYNICQPCLSIFNNCQKCSDVECLSCDNRSDYKYLDINKTQCLQQCSVGQFNDSRNQCLTCQNNCATCDQNNPQICKSCDPNNSYGNIFLTENGNCVNKCPSEFYADANNICQRCNVKYANCKECNTQFCLQCDANYCLNFDNILLSSTCEAPNPVCSSNTCSNIVNCIFCQNDKCLACSQNYFLLEDKCSQCVNPGFPSKYFINYQKQTCDLCSTKFNSDCVECNQNSCTKCQSPNLYIYNNKCENKCGDGYYANPSEYICKPCQNSNCLTCSEQQPNKCQSCPANGKTLLQNDDCVIQCDEGFLQDKNQCLPCPKNCSKCNSLTQCLKCQDQFLIDVTQSNCIQSQCPSGQYQSINQYGSDACFECSQLFYNCVKCSQNTCQQCKAPLFLYNNTCKSSCPDNYFPDENGICKQCKNLKCKTCDSTNCLSCFQDSQYPFLNESGDCVSQCESNQYLKQLINNSLICKACSSDFGTSCLQCNSQACLKCAYPQYISKLNNNSCVTDCPSGQYGNDQSHLCQNCENTKCDKCNKLNPSQCLSCISEFPYLDQGQCLSQCQEGYFPDSNNHCQSCSSKYDSNCILCNRQACTSCSPSSNLFLYKSTCISTCPDFFYPSYQDIQQCKMCLDSNCKKCNPLDPSKCLSCSDSYLFNEICTQTCPQGTFLNKKENKCMYCYSQFRSCQECTEGNCISCQDDLFILRDLQQCVSSCPFNYIDSSSIMNPSQSIQASQKTCQKCINQNCDTCDPTDTNKCLSCSQYLEYSPNKYLYKQDCIKNCDFYVNSATNECFDSCPNYLLQVEQSKQCEECPQFIQSRVCVEECTSNTYIDQIHQKLCVLCQDQFDSNCILCNAQQCLKCSQDFYLYKNKCYRQCPLNTFFDQENYVCLDKCLSPKVIVNSNICTKTCPQGQFKLPINSQNQIICGLCDNKCKECTNKSSFCTVCSKGSGWDCLDQEDFKTFLKIQYCEYLKEESEIEKFDWQLCLDLNLRIQNRQ
ncbi:hypothetical protein ABPG74_020297 [Tetrahymena malaccensis]